ncbi:hypothetical protein KCU78_g8487, partial [Aureobasidium melanogenum]
MLYRYPLPQPSYIRCFAYDYDRDISDSDDDDDTSTPRNTTFETKPMQEMELASPDQSIERDLTKTTSNPALSPMLALPAEIMFKIFQDPSLFEDDLANLRLVCKKTNLCATEEFAKERFQGSLRLDFSVQEFERLAAIYSSSLHSFLESVQFVWTNRATKTQTYARVHPDYSALKNIKIESPISSADSSIALVELLQQAKHVKAFSFSAVETRRGIHWHEQHGLLKSYWDAFDDRAGKLRQREKVDAILSKLESDCLAELSLADIIFSVRTLKALLERHRGTVRKLSIRACGLRRGSCAGLLLWVSQNLPCLEQIDLQYVYETAWGSFRLAVSEELVTKVGKESIEAYIASLQEQDR